MVVVVACFGCVRCLRALRSGSGCSNGRGNGSGSCVRWLRVLRSGSGGSSCGGFWDVTVVVVVVVVVLVVVVVVLVVVVWLWPESGVNKVWLWWLLWCLGGDAWSGTIYGLREFAAGSPFSVPPHLVLLSGSGSQTSSKQMASFPLLMSFVPVSMGKV